MTMRSHEGPAPDADGPSATPAAADESAARVVPGSFLTLHYRISLADSGEDVVSTFGGNPATLQLGIGQMAESLETCLFGLGEGAHQQFDLPCEAAFGPRNPQLVQTVSRAMLEQNSPTDTQYEPGDLVDFPAPDGGRFAGVLKRIDDAQAVFDFNHPLAGRPIRFEVRILSVL
ncbi:MAG: FKBP-type peptidyl-prolyl cis-trans isomerase [Burkholderiaceae bacterium]